MIIGVVSGFWEYGDWIPGYSRILVGSVPATGKGMQEINLASGFGVFLDIDEDGSVWLIKGGYGWFYCNPGELAPIKYSSYL